jgi:hypothetical protein
LYIPKKVHISTKKENLQKISIPFLLAHQIRKISLLNLFSCKLQLRFSRFASFSLSLFIYSSPTPPPRPFSFLLYYLAMSFLEGEGLFIFSFFAQTFQCLDQGFFLIKKIIYIGWWVCVDIVKFCQNEKGKLIEFTLEFFKKKIMLFFDK